MDKSTLNTWKKLQDNGYFEKHPLYDCKTCGIPHCVEPSDITNKIIVDIGCGYGRDTRFFANYANKVYAVDVSDLILNKCKEYMKDKYQKTPVEYILAENYKEKIPNGIDLVYALHVFQHLHPDQAKDYINTFYQKLNKNGRILVQFFIGTDKMMDEGKEPRVQYTRKEALKLFEKFSIDRVWTLEKYNKEQKLQYEHLYIIARK